MKQSLLALGAPLALYLASACRTCGAEELASAASTASADRPSAASSTAALARVASPGATSHGIAWPSVTVSSAVSPRSISPVAISRSAASASVSAQGVAHSMNDPSSAALAAALAMEPLMLTPEPSRRIGPPASPEPLNPFAQLRFRDQQPLVNRLRRLQALPFVTIWDSRKATLYLGVNRDGETGLHLRQKRDDRGTRVRNSLVGEDAGLDLADLPRKAQSRASDR